MGPARPLAPDPAWKDTEMPPERFDLHLSRPRAIVLYDLLSRCLTSGRVDINDACDEHVLSDLHTELQGLLTCPARPDFPQVLERAREVVGDPSA